MLRQVENREVVEIVRCSDNVLATHHQESGMNFILEGYTIPAEVCDAWTKVKS